MEQCVRFNFETDLEKNISTKKVYKANQDLFSFLQTWLYNYRLSLLPVLTAKSSNSGALLFRPIGLHNNTPFFIVGLHLTKKLDNF